jgi:mono/diheme cytochrome c family protein
LHVGAQVYVEHCAACHGADLEGQPDWQRPEPDGRLRAPPHDDSGHIWHHPDQLLIDYVTLGGAEVLRRLGVAGVVSGMPAFGETLSADEIDAVLDYIASHWSERGRTFQEEVTGPAEGDR